MIDCNFVNTFDIRTCLGDSLTTLNNNFSALDAGIALAQDMFNKLQRDFGAFTPGLVSIDKSILYYARFTEAYDPFDNSKLGLTGGATNNRILNHVDYNCDTDGNQILTGDASQGYYKLNTTTGVITVPPGIYDIDAEASAMRTESHCANLVYNRVQNSPDDVILQGSSEYTEQGVLPRHTGEWAPIWCKMRGRVKFTDYTDMHIVHYINAGVNLAAKGRCFTAGTSYTRDNINNSLPGFTDDIPLMYYAFFNIQKIKDV
jgi:hypothetical protein